MTSIAIDDPSMVGEARRRVVAHAERLGWTDAQAGTAALLVTEASSNVVKHAGRGVVLFGQDAGGTALEFLVLDRGPGLRDSQVMTDGVSTTGTAGLGLGSLQRLASKVEFHSNERGTAIFMRYAPDRRGTAPARRDGLRVGSLNVAMSGETVCGDGTAVHDVNGRTLIVMCDGLGHGLAAADATRAVLEACQARLGAGLPELLHAAHAAARHTRGAAVLLVEVDEQRAVVRSCGVGNVTGYLAGPHREVHLVSNNGTVGAQVRKVQEFTHPWTTGTALVMHTDGLQQRSTVGDYPGWPQRHPTLLAGLLYRDFGRGRDDASVLVARSGRREP